MLKQQIEDFLLLLTDFPVYSEAIQMLIDEQLDKKLSQHFGTLTSKEEKMIVQEITLEVSLFYHLASNLLIRKNDAIVLKRDYFEKDSDWESWIHFFCSVFDLSFNDSLFGSTFRKRLLNGTLIECLSPYYFEHINLHKEEQGLPLEKEEYVFTITHSSLPIEHTYVQKHQLTNEVADFLKIAIDSRFNFMVSSSDEKNIDFLNLLMNRIDLDERICIIDKHDRIKTNAPHVLQLSSRENVTVKNLIMNALRMRPERILIDSLESDSLFYFLQACNTGHDGSFAFSKSNSINDLKDELINDIVIPFALPVSSVEKMISDSLDFVAYIHDDLKVSFYNFDADNDGETLQIKPLFDTATNQFLEGNLSGDTREKISYYKIKEEVNVAEVSEFRKPIEVNIEEFIRLFEKEFDCENMGKVKPLMKHTISLHKEMKDDSVIPVGSSKFGGNPDLPMDITYPQDGKVAYSFIMQLNCEELQPFDKENIFPSTGMLYFFHKFEDECIPLSFDFEGNDGLKEFMKACHIFHYDGEGSTLERREKPKNLHIEKIKSAKIHFCSAATIPPPYENEELYEELGFSEVELEEVLAPLSEALRRLPFEPKEDVLNGELNSFYDQSYHQLLGEPMPAQGPPIEELVSDLSERFHQLTVSKNDWLLLCQLEVDSDLDLYWAGDGYMYYYIQVEDLKNKDFKSIYTIMQCG